MPTLLRIYAITAIALAFKMAAISVMQGRARLASKVFVNPEDAIAFGGKATAAEVPAVQRGAQAWRNDLENIPIFLILAWIYVLAGLSVAAFAVYCGVFVLARIAHTVCYLNSIQPWRTHSFTVGALATLALMLHLLIRVVF
jgi:uncharacterized MAPEG superfamily protein